MQLKQTNNWIVYSLVGFCLVALIFIRLYETQLFYDPFLVYFKNDYLNLPFPEYDTFLLLLNLISRYFFNTFFSLAIIFLLFKDFQLTKFAAFLYFFFFIILIFLFFGVLSFFDEQSNFLLFYVRRFLIQPLFLVLFIPAFYFQKKQS
ncbi:exosortase F system-associated protein [Flavobacterium sp.]|uniref:exosortase F system-associated membrane protein n=1 Tax=Flavobacterium sp. TaxID=239 RepID=UPI0025BB0BA2|nr:exosortase F system-associated protein [Flavobacterium sp.]MBA4154250.1 exosortase F system-associated protein [Flavobacterium sp.]